MWRYCTHISSARISVVSLHTTTSHPISHSLTASHYSYHTIASGNNIATTTASVSCYVHPHHPHRSVIPPHNLVLVDAQFHTQTNVIYDANQTTQNNDNKTTSTTTTSDSKQKSYNNKKHQNKVINNNNNKFSKPHSSSKSTFRPHKSHPSRVAHSAESSSSSSLSPSSSSSSPSLSSSSPLTENVVTLKTPQRMKNQWV